MNDVPWIEARTLDTETVRETWALAARHVLADVAREYHAVIGVAELGEAVQQRTRIRNRQPASQWVGDVLYRVAKDCVRRREPLLGSLCVGPDGRMSDWYADTVAAVRGDVVTDVEQHAAQERLECYRTHGAELPPDGGQPALPPQRPATARASRTSSSPRAAKTSPARPAARKPEPVAAPVCPRCFMVLPSTGICDNCD
ncbi:hypothetical protein [Nocardioides sp. 616]|uniref:hypothetical protein n=1 Tax=Nocardioides sp. 616 TaxID=2268090 RepID=UPI000CE53222|nr:hypothetical protein [Nocardioides sp. 616]